MIQSLNAIPGADQETEIPAFDSSTRTLTSLFNVLTFSFTRARRVAGEFTIGACMYCTIRMSLLTQFLQAYLRLFYYFSCLLHRILSWGMGGESGNKEMLPPPRLQLPHNSAIEE